MECPDLTALATMIPDARTPLHYRLPPVPGLLSAVRWPVGGAGSPAGHARWSGLLLSHGLERGMALAGWLVWSPFGGVTTVALWRPAGLLALRLGRHGAHSPRSACSSSPRRRPSPITSV